MPVHKDAIFEALFESTGDPDFDTLTQRALELIMHGKLLILERQAQNQLRGGKYWNPSETDTNIASNVPTTNMASERDFAHLDLLIRTKPHAYATTLSLEALIMWKNNKTSRNSWQPWRGLLFSFKDDLTKFYLLRSKTTVLC